MAAPIESAQVVAATTAGGTLLAKGRIGNDDMPVRVRLRNVTNAQIVYLGPTGVTAANGYGVQVGEGAIDIQLEAGDELYGLAVTAAQTVHVLKMRGT